MSLLNEAFDRLGESGLITVGKSLGVDLKVGLQSRPGEEKERKESFSVFLGKDGRLAFKDHARGDKGGVWNLVELLRPEFSKKQVAEHIITTAGLDPNSEKVSPRKRREDFTKKRTEAAKKHFEEATRLDDLGPCLRWPQPVKDRYASGWGKKFDIDRRAHMAEERGWPIEWVNNLVENGKISDPVLPWHDLEVSGARRGFAFLVQRPAGKRLESVGYHQRFRTEEGRPWLFCPYTPKSESVRSVYQKALSQFQQRVAPLPFVMGEPDAPLWVILEGQWDAATFWFVWQKRAPRPVFVVGVRGSNGTGVFLSAWAHYIQKHRPFIWCIADNDPAGSRWNKRVQDGCEFAEWSFVDRLRAHKASAVAYSEMPKSCGKDFNDWYRAVGDEALPRVHANMKKAFPGKSIW